MDWVARAQERLAGGIVVVTGASSGIGRAFVEAMAPSGATFVLLARRAELLDEVADGLRAAGARAHVQAVDIRDVEAGRAAAEQVLTDIGVPGWLFANAGHSIARQLPRLVERPDSIARSVATNFTGPVAHALPLLGAMSEQGRGHLLATTTVNARTSVPGWSPYVASKAGWDAWVRSVSPELRRRAVATSILAYPLVATDMVAAGRRAPFALRPARAAAWAARAVVTRQHRVAPTWLKPYEVLHAVAPATVARLTGVFSTRLADG